MLYEAKGTTDEKEIPIQFNHLLELPTLYAKAIEKYKSGDTGYDDNDVWNGEIRLIRIDFESNFKRDNYTAVFGIKEGK